MTKAVTVPMHNPNSNHAKHVEGERHPMIAEYGEKHATQRHHAAYGEVEPT